MVKCGSHVGRTILIVVVDRSVDIVFVLSADGALV